MKKYFQYDWNHALWVVALLLTSVTTTFAQSTQDIPDTSTQSTSSTKPTLSGKAVLDQATEIKQLGVAARKLQKSASDLYGEATTQKVTMMSEPEVIGRGEVISIPRPVFTGEYLPPRKKWVDHYMADLSDLIPLVKDEFADVAKAFPDEFIAEAKDSLDELNTLFDDVEKRFAQLQQLQQANNYSNGPLAEASFAINADMTKALRDGKKIFRSLKKYSKKKTSS